MKIQYVFLSAAIFLIVVFSLLAPAGKSATWKGQMRRLLSEDDDPKEAVYDPVHIGAAILINLTALGCLYWLLWTLLVFEGGIFSKIAALAKLLFTSTTAKSLGYEGYPYAMGAFEGWIGNLCALILTVSLVAALYHLYSQAAQKQKRS